MASGPSSRADCSTRLFSASLSSPKPGSAPAARGIARRHPWLSDLLHRPAAPGPNGLRCLDYFIGLLAESGLDTGVKLEIIALISGFATVYGGWIDEPPEL